MSRGSGFGQLAALIALAAGLLGCAGDLPSSQTAPSPITAAPRSTMGSAQSTAMPAADPATMGSSAAQFASARDDVDVSDDYTITAQDVLQVTVFQVPDLARTV